MTTFRDHPVFTIDGNGQITRSTGTLPAAVSLPPVRVSLAADTHQLIAARLLRRLADELEVRP